MNPSLTLEKAFAQLVDKLNNWLTLAIKMLPNLVVAIVILIFFWILSGYASRIADRLILKFTGYRHIARILSRITTLAVIVLGFILTLDALNLDKAVASMLAGIGILGLAIGFAGKDLFSDFIAGIVLHFEHPFRLGDRVQTLHKAATPSGWKSEEILGYIDSVKWRSTIIRGRRGERYTIPNKDILDNPIVNYYISGERRIDLYIGIDYTPNLQQVEDLAIEALQALEPPLRNPDRPVEFFYEEIKDTTVIFRIRFWTNETDQETFLKARSEAIKAVNEAFKVQVVVRPSAVVTLDFGITGGSTLREQLEGVELALSAPVQQAEGEKDRKEKAKEGKEKEKEGEEQAKDREKTKEKEREET